MALDHWTESMLRGDFEAAWKVSDALVQSGQHQPLWNGQPFFGRRVLIRCVHGLGDTIQFIRYVALLRLAGATRISAQMHPPLVPLMSTVPGLDHAFTWDENVEYDVDIEIMELPWAFRTTVESIPREVPYISAPLRDQQCAGRIGLVWSSSTWDETRSIPLHAFEPLKEFGPVSFQHGPDHLHAEGCRWIEYSGEQTSDLVQTASQVKSLDVLITPDTMLAHMAGALGTAVWVLLKRDADWRWMRNRNDTPWYASMRLFRQSEHGDWSPVIQEVHRTLQSRYS